MVVECNAECFRKLKNPYTGDGIKVIMLVTGTGEPMLKAVGTYSTSDGFPTSEEAFRNWSRVDGVSGLRDMSDLRCAYTGEKLGIVRDELGFHFTGGFDPNLFHRYEDFLYYVTMRDGVATRANPEHVRATYVQRTEMSAKRKAGSGDVSVSQDAMDVVEAAAEKCPLPKSGTVSMHVSGKRKGK